MSKKENTAPIEEQDTPAAAAEEAVPSENAEVTETYTVTKEEMEKMENLA